MSILTTLAALLVLMHGHPVFSYNSCVSNCFNLVESLSTCKTLCSISKSSTQNSNSTTPKSMTDSETEPKPVSPNFPSQRSTTSIPEDTDPSTTSSLESVTLNSIPASSKSTSKSPSVSELNNPSPSSNSSKPPQPAATLVADDISTKPSLLSEENPISPTFPTTQTSSRPTFPPSLSNPKEDDPLFEPGFGNESEVFEASDSLPPRPVSPTTSQSQSEILINCTVFYSIDFFSKVLS